MKEWVARSFFVLIKNTFTYGVPEERKGFRTREVHVDITGNNSCLISESMSGLSSKVRTVERDCLQ